MTRKWNVVGIGFVLLLLVAPVLVWAGSSNERAAAGKDSSRITGKITQTTEAISPPPIPGVLPIAVKIENKSLGEIQVSDQTANQVFKQEKEAYEIVKEKLTTSSQAEQATVLVELNQQRYRLYISLLNRIIVIYQRLDYIVSRMDESMLKLRVLHIKKGSPSTVKNFDSRIQELETRLAFIESQSDKVAEDLEEAKTGGMELSKSILKTKGEVSSLLQQLKSFLVDYKSLVQEVISAK